MCCYNKLFAQGLAFKGSPHNSSEINLVLIYSDYKSCKSVVMNMPLRLGKYRYSPLLVGHKESVAGYAFEEECTPSGCGYNLPSQSLRKTLQHEDKYLVTVWAPVVRLLNCQGADR